MIQKLYNNTDWNIYYKEIQEHEEENHHSSKNENYNRITATLLKKYGLND